MNEQDKPESAKRLSQPDSVATSGQTRPTRRSFIKAGGTAAVATVAPRHSLGAPGGASGEPFRFAQIGVGGQGAIDIERMIAAGAKPTAFCDVDVQRAGKTYEVHPDVARFTDYREMLEKAADQFDGVVISTPVHQHGVQALDSIARDKPVLLQTPMVRTMEECRQLTKAAKERNVVVHIANDAIGNAASRLLAAMVESGDLGSPSLIQAWTDGPDWPQGMEGPPRPVNPPITLDWNLWLGPAAERPYSQAYLPELWRGWWDFGCGALGDHGPQLLGPVFTALKLSTPRSVRATGCKPAGVAFPVASEIEFLFAAGDASTERLKLLWRDGSRRPDLPNVAAIDRTLEATAADGVSPETENASSADADASPREATADPGFTPADRGFSITGSKLWVATDGSGGLPQPIAVGDGTEESSDEIYAARQRWRDRASQQTTQVSTDTYRRWIEAVRNQGRQTSESDSPTSEIDTSLMQTILLGCIATRFPDQTLQWDATEEQFVNHDAANEWLKFTAREGFAPAD